MAMDWSKKGNESGGSSWHANAAGLYNELKELYSEALQCGSMAMLMG